MHVSHQGPSRKRRALSFQRNGDKAVMLRIRRRLSRAMRRSRRVDCVVSPAVRMSCAAVATDSCGSTCSPTPQRRPVVPSAWRAPHLQCGRAETASR
ncbi:hypothetical protein PXO_03995 [Xanthomonas oryzae pv. oryzae PXO99A]|uniref:Uncharacterized protein n=1 Tax=Xanthomonas oryzae pv. oryzae (strain PXO99A) TaxID=360094 RepID=A0A0K0GGH3_XANOP|nr:hypothetical protein PXO_03995 [Xanthomonas oryzae pv. oryzae PXO99A]